MNGKKPHEKGKQGLDHGGAAALWATAKLAICSKSNGQPLEVLSREMT